MDHRYVNTYLVLRGTRDLMKIFSYCRNFAACLLHMIAEIKIQRLYLSQVPGIDTRFPNVLEKLVHCRNCLVHLVQLEKNVGMEKTDIVIPLTMTNWTAVINRFIFFAENYRSRGLEYIYSALLSNSQFQKTHAGSIRNMFHQIQTFYYIPAIKLTQDNSRLLKQSDISDSELLAEIMDMDPNTATDPNAKNDELSESDLRF